jgi:hypothetical protein
MGRFRFNHLYSLFVNNLKDVVGAKQDANVINENPGTPCLIFAFLRELSMIAPDFPQKLEEECGSDRARRPMSQEQI